MWKGKMTEKSEDQVIWVWFNEDESNVFTVDPENPAVKPYIPHSKYLALQSDLALAVEALREIKECGSKTVPQTFPWYISRMIGIAKEALGKIGGGKCE
jgi:hypothetical protein